MSPSGARLRIGFIPLNDATALLVAVDKGFTAEEGLNVELVREVSWSNVRDKLNIGLFDAAHLIAPVAIASSALATGRATGVRSAAGHDPPGRLGDPDTTRAPCAGKRKHRGGALAAAR